MRARPWAWQGSVVHSILDNEYRVLALRELVLALDWAQQWDRAESVWSEAKDILQVTQENAVKDQELTIWKELIQAQQWDRAEVVVSSIQDSGRRDKALWELGTELVRAQQWDRAEMVMRSIQKNEYRGWALQVLGEALVSMQQCSYARAVFDEAEELWEEAWKETKTEKNETNAHRDEIDAMLEKTEAMWHEGKAASSTIRELRENTQLAEVLRELGVALINAQQWDHAEAVVYMINEDYERAKVLRELGMALTHAQQGNRAERVWVEAKEAASLTREQDGNSSSTYDPRGLR